MIETETDGDVFLRRKKREERIMLVNDASIAIRAGDRDGLRFLAGRKEKNLPLTRQVRADYGAEESRFATTARAYQRKKLAPADLQIHVGQNTLAAEPVVDSARLKGYGSAEAQLLTAIVLVPRAHPRLKLP